jgi:hypothetical protein
MKKNANYMNALGKLVLVLFLSVLFGCASRKPIWGDAETGFILQYRMVPDQLYEYTGTSQENSVTEMMGQTMESETNITSNYTIATTGIDDQKNLLTEITLNSLDWFSKSMQGERTVDTEGVVGKSFGLTFSPCGKELEYTGVDTLPQIDMGRMEGKRSIKSIFRSVLPDLPAEPTKIGGSWVSKEEFTENQSNMDITIVIESDNTLEGLETINGNECLKIKTKSSGTLDGTGSMMGADMTFEGDLEGESTWYFDYKKGFFVKSNSEGIMEGTVAVSGQANMTIPISQESQSEIQLVQ